MEIDSKGEKKDIKSILYRYFPYWPWILLSVIVMMLGAYLYLRYTPNVYNTTAKIKILSDKEATDLSLDIDKLFGKGKVNLENERGVFSSYRLNEQVVERLNLQVSYFQSGRVNEIEVFNTPFKAEYVPKVDTLTTSKEFAITITSSGYHIRNMETEEILEISSHSLETPTPRFPFKLEPQGTQVIVPGNNPEYIVRVTNKVAVAQRLVNNIKINPLGRDSDILILNLVTKNGLQAQNILNTLIEVYIEDGISDRQEVSKRTIDFIDERFQYLTNELDSIEIAKGNYKESNNLSIFEADAGAIITKRNLKDEQLFEVETQLLLANVLETSMENIENFKLLPANVGLNSGSVSNLVKNYNEAVLEYDKWKASAGDNNPQLKILKQTIIDLNSNIRNSLANYKNQLKQSLRQNQRAQNLAQSSFSSLPDKEMILRSIERQQELKENLYLLLLQKREESAINIATTASNVKVIDYAITNSIPVSPKRRTIFLQAIIVGLLLPLGIIYLRFATNNKIHTSKDIEAINPQARVLGEIPEIANTREINSEAEEAFRTLGHHLNFMLNSSNLSKEGGRVIAVTSSVKGEGKTTVSYHVARSYNQLRKSVILIGGDLRNPQLHPYVNENKSKIGLSNYINEEDLDWRDLIISVNNNSKRFDVLLSGTIPPMPSVLLSSDRFKNFLQEVRKQYDYVIIDTAPTLLVSDTLTFMSEIDITLYVVRAGVTEKDLISYSKKLVDLKKISQMGYVINDMDFKGSYGYGYNYGYGYGYHADTVKKPWYQFWG